MTEEKSATVNREEARELLAVGESLLREYVRLLLEENARARLVGPTDPDVIWRSHVLDCAATLPLVRSAPALLDLGSGGGLPGMVWAACLPKSAVVLCDSVRKKTLALERMARALGLANVRVVPGRSEDLALRERGSFGGVGTRAVAALGVVAEYAAPLVAPGGFALAMKGPAWREEAAEVGPRWGRLGLGAPEIWTYDLGEGLRTVVRWWRTGAPPAFLPRRPGMAEKQPWWR